MEGFIMSYSGFFRNVRAEVDESGLRGKQTFFHAWVTKKPVVQKLQQYDPRIHREIIKLCL